MNAYGIAVKACAKRTYDAYVHLPVEFPLKADGHRPVSERFRRLSDELLVQTLKELEIPYHIIGGTVLDRLQKIVEIFDLPLVMALPEAVEVATERVRHATAVIEEVYLMIAHNAPHSDVIVIGAGPGGLAVCRELGQRGIATRVIERGEHAGARWSGFYESVRLNSTRGISALPGMRIPRRYGRWVARDDLVEYLRDYAQHTAASFEFGVEAQRVERGPDGWRVQTSAGDRQASGVVLATGIHGIPWIPEWAMGTSFRGSIVHAMQYHDPTPYQGQDVLVVGTGASGHDVALNLARGGAARVRISVRTPPILAPRRIAGVSTAAVTYLTKHYVKLPESWLDWASLATHRFFYPDAARFLGPPTVGMMTAFAERGHGITMEVGLLSALKAGTVTAVAAVERLDTDDVVLCDGTRIQPDAVILATGQRTGLTPLLGHLDVLAADERPLVHGAQTLESAPGLHFIGYRLPGGQLPDMRYDAPRIARNLQRYIIRLRKPTSTMA